MSNNIKLYTKINLAIVFIWVMSLSFETKAQNPRSIHITVQDSITKEKLPGVVLMIGKQNTITDLNGKATLNYNPKESKQLLTTQYIGYIPQTIDLSKRTVTGQNITINLKEKIQHLDAVKVFANKPRTEMTTVAVKVSTEGLKKYEGKNLADLLNQLPGLSAISTGATIMKPVIQGMHSSRILLINNGVKQEGQQWGSDHAPEVDASSASDLEVIKGAESIRYGSGAIGGVILMNSAPLPIEEQLTGNYSLQYSTNSSRMGINADLGGGSKKFEGFRWRALMGGSYSGDYKTADYYLNNTGTRLFNAVLNTGLKKERYDIQAFGSVYYSKLGIFYGSHINTLEQLQKVFEYGRPLIVQKKSFKITNPKQEVLHIIGRLNARYTLDNNSQLKFQYDFQHDNRDEYEIRRGEFNKRPALGLSLNTHSMHFAWESDKHIPLRFITGTTLTYQNNVSDNKTKTIPLIPNYLSEGVGLWGIAQYVKPSYEIEAGARYDYQYMDAMGYDSKGKAYGGTNHYHSPSFSLSAIVRPTNGLNLLSNIGLAWRAPEVNELYSRGLHHGAASFEIGDVNLKPEHAVKWNNELQYINSRLSLNATGFIQWIGNYIFDQPSRDKVTGEPETWPLLAGVFPVFRYQQMNALFYGGDIKAKINLPFDLSYTAQAEWIRAENRETKGYLPYIPSDHYSQTLEYNHRFSRGMLDHIEFSLTHRYVAKQTRFDKNIDFVDKTPAAYNLFEVGAGMQLNLKNDKRLIFYLDVDNLFNKLYKEYTNRFRYYAHEKGRDIQFRLRYEF